MWHCWRRPFIVCCVLGPLIGQSVGPEPAKEGAKRGFDPPPGPPVGPGGKGKRRALIVGINYQGDKAAKGPLEPLAAAETDARSIHATLLSHFGYNKDDDAPLIGTEATKPAIQEELEKLGDPKKVSEEDSVLFFFAGHGDRRLKTGLEEGYCGELIPYGAKFDEEEAPAFEAVLQLRWVQQLLASSRARHKLLILDCCHAGEMFNLPLAVERGNPLADGERWRKEKTVPSGGGLGAWRVHVCVGQEGGLGELALHGLPVADDAGSGREQGDDGVDRGSCSRAFRTISRRRTGPSRSRSSAH